jgi:hypothetical protein
MVLYNHIATARGSCHADNLGYRPHEVQMMMEQLWAEYVNPNPRLFDVHD